jgi:predicted transcriptional regulator YdeE
MKMIRQEHPLTVVGLELRTNNQEAATTIPAFWTRFFSEGTLQRIAEKNSGDIFAVYTSFEHEGIDNQGQYSLVIGAQVESSVPAPDGMVKVTIPPSERMFFEVQPGRMDLVGEKWLEIWADTRKKSYVADYEHYGESGQIRILIGVL